MTLRNARRFVATTLVVACGPPEQPQAVVTAAPDTVPLFEFQVDRKVDVDPEAKVRPRYPDALRREGIDGIVRVRFVVDTFGFPEIGSIRVIESTHRYFTDAVLAVLPQIHYLPAESKARKVRQLTEQQFHFAPTP